MRGISLIFFLSGATGLVYEVVWAKALAAVLGSSGLAQVVTLATFLGGLAIGYARLGARVDREPDPLAFYGRLELGVAAAGLWSLVAIQLFHLLAGALQGLGGLSAPAFMGLRLVAAIATMAPGAILMGGTLPALGRHLAGSLAAVQASVARLYFLNSLGGAFGALVGAMVLVPWWGLPGAIVATALLNLALAAAVRAGVGRAVPAAADAAELPGADADAGAAAWLAPWLAAGSGFAVLMLEVAWTRALALALGPSAPGFALMLAAVVAGIAAGSWVVARVRLPVRNPLVGYGAAQVLAAIVVLASLPLADRLGVWLLDASVAIGRAPISYGLYLLIQLGLSLLFVAPAAMLVGMGLPFAARAATRRVDEVGERVGAVFAANTAGTVLGATVAGTLLLPALGLRGLFVAAALLTALAGAIALAAAAPGTGPRRHAPLAAALAAVVALAALVPAWDPRYLYGGAYRTVARNDVKAIREFHEQRATAKPLFIEDDPHVSVSVEEMGASTVLRVDGKVDASSNSDMPTQLLLAHVPLVRDPAAKDVMLIGYGSGVTAGAALAHPIARLDLAEISGGVIAAGRYFEDLAGKPLADPRLRLHQEDALGFMQRTSATYDVILSEPSNPWMAGVAALFTRDYYERCRAHLRPGGQMVQWLQTYELDDESVQMVLRTFRDVFPHVEIWQGLVTDLIVVGSTTPMRPSLDGMAGAIARPKVQASLAELGMSRLPTLLSCQVLAPADVERIAGDGPRHTAWFPRLEAVAPAGFFFGRQSRVAFDADRRLHANAFRAEAMWIEQLAMERGKIYDEADYAEIVTYHGARTKNLLVADAFAGDWERRRPDDTGLQALLISRARAAGRLEDALGMARAGQRRRPAEPVFAWAAAEVEIERLERGLATPDADAAIGRLERDFAWLAAHYRKPVGRLEALRVRAYAAARRPAPALAALMALERIVGKAPTDPQEAEALAELRGRVAEAARRGPATGP